MVNPRIDGVELGQVTAENIYSRDGNLLVKEGTIISYELISKLKKHKVNYREILTSIAEDFKDGPVIPDEVMIDSADVVKKVFDDVINRDKATPESAIPVENLDLVKRVVEELMALLMNSDDLLYHLSEVMNIDDYTYRHGVNVTILSILTAKAMGYKYGEIHEIAMGALLHDIGKAAVPGALIRKSTRLTPEEIEIIKEHPQLGYELVKDLDAVPKSVKDIIHYHHEKLDGSGYPEGLSGLDIPKHVRLVTVCDMYDAMTTSRSYRKRMPLHTALEILMKDSVYKIDPEVYRQMTGTICLYPKGMGVILSNGKVGIVSEYRHQNPTRPVIQVVDFDLTQGSVNVEAIDLEIIKTLFIIDTWDVSGFSTDFSKSVDKSPFHSLPETERDSYTSSIC